jgi:hypothetical protein|nr:MAG TPA: outer capsid protein sigma-1 attachment protein [Caudoviricetes sp.]
MKNSISSANFPNTGAIQINSGTIEGDLINQRDINQFIMEHYATKVSTLENTVDTISQEVKDIKENYLTASTFYRSGIVALVVLVGAAWALYSHMDTKYENRFSAIDQRFEKVESNIHSLDVRLTKVESRLDNVELRLTNVEKKLDNIDDKLDILIQQKQAKK